MEFGAYLSTLPTYTPPTPKPPAQPETRRSSFFVIPHKNAAIKMHWSRTALGRDGLAFPGQRPVSLPIHWGLFFFFFKVNAFSLEWEGAAFEAVGGWERDNTPLFPSPFCFTHLGRARRKPPAWQGGGWGWVQPVLERELAQWCCWPGRLWPG